ncbi:primosomal protein N' [Furfurilactobacillus siliginis]|uniref:Replication restart protein PriA n=1 Tax=Furfurilactobacillus siliginis TaxID=348151 RepID=A0A0R2LD10_9LACO|nr:primosomal protein N' [Furfurilactobacillus siliginis]KRN96890.1 primosomal protein n [Furfurilactobacillus siliginis]GEK28086.1 primosomal protein N' [Furfurilactobacillus siliginis]
MAKIAQVIVDVPTMQTNRPYSYLVPSELADAVHPGMRVSVPFGKGGREVGGMVIGVDEQAQTLPTFSGKLKPLTALLDLASVLNPELLELSDWLATHTFAFRISTIQTMLPAALKTKSHKLLVADQSIADAHLAGLFTNGQLDFTAAKLAPNEVDQLAKLQQSGIVHADYAVENRAKVKTVTWVQSQLTTDQIVDVRPTIRANATKQQQLLDVLTTCQTPQPLAKLTENSALARADFSAAAKRGWVTLTERESYRDPYAQKDIAATRAMTLHADQAAAVAAITGAIESATPQPFLLEGVTGSGKTEVYLQSIAAALAQGKTALMLVPEIALTPQMVNRVRGRFGKQVAVLHSGLSAGEKYDEWRRIERHEAAVVVGARSAAFAPLDNIGLIVMDEEHETSYKQDDNPRYHARDVLLWRAKYHHAPVVLGSATPSLESRARAERGVYQSLLLPERINQQPLPPVTVIDMREQLKAHTESNFSTALLDALKLRLERGEQSVLMLNRRGFSSFVMCRDCGFVLKCPNCDVSLVLHMDTHTMKCHYCGHEETIPKICPNCHSRRISYYGSGTEKVAAELTTLLPDVRIIRMDADTTRRKGAYEKLLTDFGEHKADILLGTQMIAKGLDYPDVTLVGVLNADTALGLPDFRASERTFQLLTQVSGRAGRADKPGEVFIQTFNPDHYAIQLAQKQDYERFFRVEMKMRHLGNYPPYYYTALITASAQDENVAARRMFELAEQLKAQLSDTTVILGPTPRSIARINNRYYYQIVLKYKQEPHLQTVLAKVLDDAQKEQRQGLQVAIDMEPQSFI